MCVGREKEREKNLKERKFEGENSHTLARPIEGEKRRIFSAAVELFRSRSLPFFSGFFTAVVSSRKREDKKGNIILSTIVLLKNLLVFEARIDSMHARIGQTQGTEQTNGQLQNPPDLIFLFHFLFSPFSFFSFASLVTAGLDRALASGSSHM